MLKKKIIFTSHAKERLEANGLSLQSAYGLFNSAVKTKRTLVSKTSSRRDENDERNQNIVYFTNGSIAFVCRHLFPKEKYICLTVYDQKLSLMKPRYKPHKKGDYRYKE